MTLQDSPELGGWKRKLELWFFRDLSDEQRLALFRLFGMPVDEIGRVHSHQQKVLRRILAASPAVPSSVEALAKPIIDFICDDVLPSYDIPCEVGRDDPELATAVHSLLAALSRPSVAEGAVADIAAERRRQIEVEGWTPEHDDSKHSSGQLAIAAACYAISGGAEVRHLLAQKRWTLYEGNQVVTAFYWLWSLTIKWSSDWYKPSSRRRDLVKAGALIVAEIERLDRAALKRTGEGEAQ